MKTASDFLARFHPAAAWVLTAIEPNQKGITTKAYSTDAAKAKAQDGITSWDGKRNLYYSVAEVLDPTDKKASRANVKAVHYLHVDIDAEAGKDLQEELERIKKLLTTKLPESIPKPTIIVFSGGGYQAFWKLDEPIQVNGNLEACDMVAKYNKQIEIVLGGDSCSNVDRIMRLPFTQNIPNQRKLAKGRRQVEAKILRFTKATYNLSEFTAAVDVGTTAGDDATVDIGGNIKRLATIDDLNEWNVPDSLKVIAVQGKIPDEPKEGDNSRSAWVFHLACGLVRHEVPDEVVYSILTDPGFKIAESVLEANNPHRYAIKQIKSAKEAAVSEWLAKLNARYAVIGSLGGKCRVIEEVFDVALKRDVLVKQSFEDFRNRYLNVKETVTVQNSKGEDVTKLIPVGKFWLEHPKRREFDRIIFIPGEEVEGAYNLWRGWSTPAIPGKAHESFLDHIKNIICSGDEVHYKYLMQWLAKMVQFPANPGEIAFVMRGRPGTGKSFFAKQIGALFGRHFMHVSNASHLVGQFNSHLRDVVCLFADEAFYAGDKKHESTLKMLITEPTLVIEAKGVDAETSPNFTHIILASNSDWVVPVGAADRRYFIVDVDESRERDQAYFGGMQRELDGGGLSNLLHYLLHEVDLANFNTQNIPQTKAGADQKALSLKPHEEWWLNCLQEGRLGTELWGSDPVANAAIWESYDEYTQGAPSFHKLTRIKLTKFLGRVNPKGTPQNTVSRVNGETCRVKIFATLQECRDAWDRYHRVDTDWEEAIMTDGGEIPF